MLKENQKKEQTEALKEIQKENRMGTLKENQKEKLTHSAET